MLSPENSVDLHAGWDLGQKGEGLEPAVPDSSVAWGHAADAYQVAGLGSAFSGIVKKLAGREGSRGTQSILKQTATPPALRLDREKIKGLFDSIPNTLDEPALDQKFIDTGTLNLERAHQGSAPYQTLHEISKGDPAAMLDAAENAQDLTKVLNLIGTQMGLKDAPRTHKSITSRTREQMAEDLAPILEGKQIGLANDKQLHALSNLLAASGDALLTTARAIKSGKGTDEMRITFAQQVETAAAIEALLVNNTREVARALSARRIYADSLKGADLASLTRAFETNGMSSDAVDKAASNFLDAYLKKGKLRATHSQVQNRDLLGAAIEFWKSNILSGPSGQIANLLTSAATHMYESFAIDPAAAAVSTARRALGIGGDEGVYFSEMLPGLRGSFVGTRDGLKSAWEILFDPKALGMFGDSSKAGGGSSMVALGESLGGTAGRRTGAALIYPLRVMKSADEVVQTVAYRAKLAELQTRDAMDRGLRGKDLQTFLDHALDNPFTEHDAVAKEYAKTVTFQSKQVGGITGLLTEHTSKLVDALPPLKFLAPFVKTMGNLTAYAIDNSPLAVAAVDMKGPGWAKSQLFNDLLAGGAKADYAFARFTMGSAFAAMAYTLYQNGVITGDGPANPRQEEAAKRAGWRPEALIVGDTTYTYDRLDPFATMLSTVASAFDRARFAKTEEDAAGHIFNAVSAFAHHLSNSNFAGQAKQFLEIMDGDSGVAASKMAGNILTGFIPYSSLLASAGRSTDESRRVGSFSKQIGFSGTESIADIGQIIAQTGAVRLPWKRDELRPARYWDSAIITPASHELVRFLLPVQISAVSKDPASLALLRNGISPQQPSPLVSLRGVQFNLLDFDLGKGVVYDAYIEAVGEFRKQAVDEVLGDTGFKAAGSGVNSAQALVLEKAISKGHQAGEAKFFSEILPRLARAKETDLNPLAQKLGQSLEATMEDIKSGRLVSSRAERFNARGAPGKREVQLPMFDF